MKRVLLCVPAVLLVLMAALLAPPAHALDDEHWASANAAMIRGIAYLRSTQNEDGSWSPKPGPAITALAVQVMLQRPEISPNDPAVRKAIDYILSHAHEDGSIHSGVLENYNTSICLSALVLVPDDPEVARAVAGAQAYLKGLQWTEGMVTPDGQTITRDHPYFGGVGYGNHGRPDGSNLNYMIQAMHDAGVDCNDAVFQNALVYIHRLQGIASNDLYAEQIEPDGGFIYATAISNQRLVPESKANPVLMKQAEEDPETVVSGLRTYGSMTYSMFKSMLYANLDRDDPRVTAVRGWISKHWTLDQNPGMPYDETNLTHLQGLYYYYMALSKALDAWGSSTIKVGERTVHAEWNEPKQFSEIYPLMAQLTSQGIKSVEIMNEGGVWRLVSGSPEEIDWANALIDKLVSLQQEDGSWVNQADRWYEGDANLVTCYALLALQGAVD